MKTIDGTGAVVEQPDWASMLNDELDIAAAREYWRVVTNEMRDRQTLSAANGHSIQRLVVSYIVYDRSARQVAETGAVLRPRRGNKNAITRLSPHFTAMREAAGDAAQLEAELGLSPRRRGAVTKVERKANAPRPSDSYLKTVPRG